MFGRSLKVSSLPEDSLILSKTVRDPDVFQYLSCYDHFSLYRWHLHDHYLRHVSRFKFESTKVQLIVPVRPCLGGAYSSSLVMIVVSFSLHEPSWAHYSHSTLRRHLYPRSFIRMVDKRMASTITGDSGRVYTNARLLRRHPYDNKLDIYKAEFVPRPLNGHYR